MTILSKSSIVIESGKILTEKMRFNSEGEADYTKGFTPNYAVSELSDFAKVLPLGDPKEALFSAQRSLLPGFGQFNLKQRIRGNLQLFFRNRITCRK